MGRVSRYKKIKACDPFSKQNGGRQSMTGVWSLGDNDRRKKKRSKTATAMKHKKLHRRGAAVSQKDDDVFDLPPTGGDEFDLTDPFSVKKQLPPVNELEGGDDVLKTVTQSTTGEDTLQDALDEETRVARLLRIDVCDSPGEPAASLALARLPGEGRKVHQQRIKTDTQKIIRKDKLQHQNPDKRRRKKEFLANKKRKKQKRRMSDDDVDDYRVSISGDLDATDTFVTGEQAAQRIAFGEQVERPPTFLQLPRGADAKRQRMTTTRSGEMTDAVVEAEQRAMEKMRLKVQGQYALVRARRRNTEDFHL